MTARYQYSVFLASQTRFETPLNSIRDWGMWDYHISCKWVTPYSRLFFLLVHVQLWISAWVRLDVALHFLLVVCVTHTYADINLPNYIDCKLNCVDILNYILSPQPTFILDLEFHCHSCVSRSEAIMVMMPTNLLILHYATVLSHSSRDLISSLFT